MIDIKGFKGEQHNDGRKFVKKVTLFITIAIAVILLYHIFSCFFEYVQIKEIGAQYTSVFFKRLITGITVQTASFLSIFVLIISNVFIVRKNLGKLGVECGIIQTKRMSFLISLLIAVILGTVFVNSFTEKLLMFMNPQWFGKVDPVFGKDIGYYIFQRPFLFSITSSIMSVWIFAVCFVAILYWVFGTASGGYRVRELLQVSGIAVHTYINIGIILFINCILYMFKAEDILYSQFGEFNGAGFTNKTIWLNYYRISPYLTVILVVLAGIFLSKKKTKGAVISVLVYPAVLIITAIAALIVQTIVVSPNEVIQERENISHNIDFTQDAYGIDDISEVVFDVKNDLQVQDLQANKNAIDNIRILDLEANLTVLNQIQGIRNYYHFNETDVVPYEINGKKTAVAITAREITKDNLSDSADTYINKTLRYTHGFGVAMNEINKVSAQGQPEFLIKDIPPKSAEGIHDIKQPRIYYGELTNDYVVVGNEKYKELDYSEGQEDIEFSYDGNGGLRLGFFNRLMFAAKYGDMRLLISDLVSDNSRILINRNIIDRLKMVAPFLTYDADPYIVIDDDGSLKWIVDAYTTTANYPYAQSFGDFNYIRNSVKAVVDAYNGDVTLYIVDWNDPLARSYNQMYPTLFSKDDMPSSLKKYMKYPEYMFKVKASVYGKYHISDPTVFYNKSDNWVVATEKYGTTSEAREIAPYYSMMKLENEASEEMLLTIPYTLANKDNMVAWLAVRNEWDNYGKLQIYKFPKDINVYGPMQVENRINSDTEIVKELNLWSQGGSKVIRGNMIVVPIKNSIMYVEPIYITSSNQSALPELKQVIVAYNEKIVMRSTLSDAIYALFDAKVPLPTENDVTGNPNVNDDIADDEITYDEAAQRVVEEFKRVKEATANNDWGSFGESMNALEQSVSELEKSITENKE